MKSSVKFPAKVHNSVMHPAVYWAIRNCKSYVNVQMTYNDTTYYDLLFTDENDAIFARMTWS